MAVDFVDPGDPDAVAADLAAAFTDEHGRPPDGVFTAPGRVNLIGEHLDYNGGRCLPFALPHATYAATGVREDDLLTVRSLQVAEPWSGRLGDLGPGSLPGWVAYVGGVVWALREDGIDVPGLDLVLDSRVPLGSGLSSSAALECAVALAACAAAGVAWDEPVRERVVAACIKAENEVAGAATGGLDQTVAVHAEPDHALLLDFADGSRRQVSWAPEQSGLSLLVLDTRVHHQLSDGGYGDRRAECEAAARALGVDRLASVTDQDAAAARLADETLVRRTRHVVTENARVVAAVAALEAGDLAALGPLFDASHASLRDDFSVSCEELDVACAVAVETGALGARMTGGGFGGSAI
ncbi:MAG TPA: galactokinase, partial [Nocardioides sp.]|nr:galactokinase [Nocardioides sp.]